MILKETEEEMLNYLLKKQLIYKLHITETNIVNWLKETDRAYELKDYVEDDDYRYITFIRTKVNNKEDYYRYDLKNPGAGWTSINSTEQLNTINKVTLTNPTNSLEKALIERLNNIYDT